MFIGGSIVYVTNIASSRWTAKKFIAIESNKCDTLFKCVSIWCTIFVYVKMCTLILLLLSYYYRRKTKAKICKWKTTTSITKRKYIKKKNMKRKIYTSHSKYPKQIFFFFNESSFCYFRLKVCTHEFFITLPSSAILLVHIFEIYEA